MCQVTMDPDLSQEEKSELTGVLAGGVWRAQQNLRPAMPPMPPDGAAMFLLQQYSDKLLSLVERRFNKSVGH
ncbi:hypothetical protein LAZ67_2006493 [Cordylochernes scorpioides]|uniref:Uncharacterized protein n=1 Tax=Cordylochernes scorpioides TaxID=51811 RepID=A0ABY6K668_9ARAC|nr:hypothetical protein LAZ67_2006493 [Cordylochernes scorpioides]